MIVYDVYHQATATEPPRLLVLDGRPQVFGLLERAVATVEYAPDVSPSDAWTSIGAIRYFGDSYEIRPRQVDDGLLTAEEVVLRTAALDARTAILREGGFDLFDL